MQNGPVIAVEKSQNYKIGKVSATYVAMQSCPTSCPLLDAGCYGQGGNVRMHERRVAEFAGGLTPEEIATFEADAIGTLTGDYPLRLHVVGDAKTDAAAAILAEAASEYTKRGGEPVYAYTHGWMEGVKRESWGDISVLASVHTADDAKRALDEGYGAAVVYTTPDDHPLDKATRLDNGVKLVPCPQQTKKGCGCDRCKRRAKISCESCGMCMRQAVAPSIAIGFLTHGFQKNKADKSAVEVTA